MDDAMDLTLPFGPADGSSRMYKLDQSRKAQTRSLASKLGISYTDPGHQFVLPSAESHPVLYDHAAATLQAQGGPQAVNPDDLTARKMACAQGSDESVFLNILGGLAGFLIFDLPDGKGGFVLIDPRLDRTTAWHPDKSTREAACVCGSLVLRDAKKRGLNDVDDLANALNSMAIDQDTGLMLDLEKAFGHIDIKTIQDQAQEQEEETINLTQVDLPNVNKTPNWLSYPHAAGAAETRPGGGRLSNPY
ncbi:hypothetical protein HKX48_000712 [Thoreauomyces humboldtii]|nr:hypothetical protein HKX48_000712 [Thoreauomyces humboldtii]